MNLSNLSSSGHKSPGGLRFWVALVSSALMTTAVAGPLALNAANAPEPAERETIEVITDSRAAGPTTVVGTEIELPERPPADSSSSSPSVTSASEPAESAPLSSTSSPGADSADTADSSALENSTTTVQTTDPDELALGRSEDSTTSTTGADSATTAATVTSSSTTAVERTSTTPDEQTVSTTTTTEQRVLPVPSVSVDSSPAASEATTSGRITTSTQRSTSTVAPSTSRRVTTTTRPRTTLAPRQTTTTARPAPTTTTTRVTTTTEAAPVTTEQELASAPGPWETLPTSTTPSASATETRSPETSADETTSTSTTEVEVSGTTTTEVVVEDGPTVGTDEVIVDPAPSPFDYPVRDEDCVDEGWSAFTVAEFAGEAQCLEFVRVVRAHLFGQDAKTDLPEDLADQAFAFAAELSGQTVQERDPDE